jgi:hypothetical protein
MEEGARFVLWESIRIQQDQVVASIVPQTRIPRASARKHAQCVQRTPMLLQGPRSAPVILGRRDRTEALAHHVKQGSLKRCQVLPHAPRALWGHMGQEWVPPRRPYVLIVPPESTQGERGLPNAATVRRENSQKNQERTHVQIVVEAHTPQKHRKPVLTVMQANTP